MRRATADHRLGAARLIIPKLSSASLPGMVGKQFWNGMVVLLVVLSVRSFIEHWFLLRNASPEASARCARAADSFARNTYSNCLRRNQ